VRTASYSSTATTRWSRNDLDYLRSKAKPAASWSIPVSFLSGGCQEHGLVYKGSAGSKNERNGGARHRRAGFIGSNLAEDWP